VRRRFPEQTRAEKTGGVALLLALLLAFFSPALAIAPLAFFLLLCLAAPFFPAFAFFLPVISQGNPDGNRVALTFDDGPWPASTPILLELLARHQLRATFFVVGQQAAQFPELIEAILAQGHSIGNHSLRHDPFLMLRPPAHLQGDIHATQEILKKFGIRPRVFRPPAGITNPVLGRVLARENLIAVGYSCRAFDRGNRNVRNLAGKILRQLKPGGIVMLHDLPPQQETMYGCWQKELDRLFSVLQHSGRVVALEEILRQPVMESAGEPVSVTT